MKKHLFYTFLLIITRFLSNAQEYPKAYFIPPLDPPLIITGTFGEIRENHFHSGIDLSTNEEEGIPVMAAADGYVSRIKISSDGYGKAIYITHPNGYVTVYGHLQKFGGPLYGYVRKLQYEKQIFEMDLKPAVNEFVIKQKDIIGYSGSSGGADAPHLHFEIRDEKTEEPINPLLFGFTVKDNIPPRINNVRIFPLRENGILNESDSAVTYFVQPDSTKTKNVLNTYEAPMVYGSISFGFNAIDHADGTYIDSDSNYTELGIYSSELFVDKVLIFSTRFDRFNFNDTRNVNAHIDYSLKKDENILIERCHKLPGDHLKFYGGLSETGYTFFGEDSIHTIKIVVRDFNGNKSEIEFTVAAYASLSEKPVQPAPIDGIVVTNKKGLGIHKSKFEVIIPEGAVYQDFYYEESAYHSNVFLSDIFRIGNPNEPLQIPISVSLKPGAELSDSLKPKAVIVLIDANGNLKSCGGQWEEKFLKAKSINFGDFAITLDTIPPTVEKYYVPADMNAMYGGQVRLIVKDELSGLKNYSGMIDDKWHLFEYDKKSDMLIANVDGFALGKEHTIEVSVTDERGNTTVWKSMFFY